MLNKQEEAYRQKWSILQAICNDEEGDLMDQLREEGQLQNIDDLEQILVMCEFALIADILPNYIYSMREALLRKVTDWDKELASKEKSQILNEASPPPENTKDATGLQEKVNDWINDQVESRETNEKQPAFTFQVCSRSPENYLLEPTPPGFQAGGGGPATAAIEP